MDAIGIGGVAHLVLAPVVEDPALACSHVYRLAVAGELDLRQCLDRKMYARPIEPVAIDIGMPFDLGPRRESQQSRAAPNHSEPRQYLPYVRKALKVSRHTHRAMHLIVVAAADTDQSHGGITGLTGRVRDPGLCGNILDFRAQAGDVESHRETIESLWQAHLSGDLSA